MLHPRNPKVSKKEIVVKRKKTKTVETVGEKKAKRREKHGAGRATYGGWTGGRKRGTKVREEGLGEGTQIEVPNLGHST